MAVDSNILPPSRGIKAVLPNPTTPWYKQTHLVKLNGLLLGLVCFQSALGYDGNLLNGLQSLPQWSNFMDHPTGEWSGFINVIYFIGFFVACPPSSWLANKYGRRLPAFLAFIPLALGTGFQTGAKSEAERIAGRFIIGVSTAVFATSILLLITEIAYPSHRSVMTALTNCNFFIGGIIAAWTCYGTRNYTDWAWRLPTILQIALPLVTLPALILVSESPRWLVSVGREEAARKTLGRLHAGGDSNHPLVDLSPTKSPLPLNPRNKPSTISGSFAQTRSHAVGIIMIPFVFLFNAGYAVAVTPLQTAYPLELWPFQLRSRGLSVAWMIMILALIFNVFINPIALSAIGWKYYVVYVALLLSYGLIIFFFYPETRGRTPKEISVIFGDAPDGLYSDELETKQVVEEADAKYLG
ncbi:lactose permease [Fusarium beomiforme]|uniref:Lactose permease n=1 Tax=Fusarium beomiforme TaxID=44412 RepID=A0A9P5DRP6_9HYPO|nr:lactose permease [Fusarium beomiforme]